ncbi:hypothetical protein SD80_015395 [Scytonema tolypothrichoides VB-61278]|nr:hypothetical protein SD80_015395 [Scytonema tolypothrichoides VB-61278]
MSNFEKNVRVVVIRGEHCNNHGKVIGETIYGFLSREIPVELDEYGKVNIPEGDLDEENLTPDEVTAEIKYVSNQVERVASQLPGEMGKELPNHLRFLGDALMSKDKPKADDEYTYVVKNLKRASENGSVPQDWWETVRISFDKIHGAVKRLP